MSKTIKCLLVKDAFAAGLTPSRAKDGRILHRYVECRTRATTYRGAVAIAVSNNRTHAGAEFMAESFRISVAEAQEYTDWIYQNYRYRIITVLDLVACESRLDDSLESEQVADDSWFPDHGDEGWFWKFRPIGDGTAPLILEPKHAPLVTDVCAGCQAGQHWKHGDKRHGVEGNFHIGLFDVRI